MLAEVGFDEAGQRGRVRIILDQDKADHDQHENDRADTQGRPLRICFMFRSSLTFVSSMQLGALNLASVHYSGCEVDNLTCGMEGVKRR